MVSEGEDDDGQDAEMDRGITTLTIGSSDCIRRSWPVLDASGMDLKKPIRATCKRDE